MSKGVYFVPTPKNEPVKGYAPGSPEKESLLKVYNQLKAQILEVPMYIGSTQIKTENKKRLSMPHNHAHTLGYFYYGNKTHVQQAIDAALSAKEAWANLAWEHRASIFLKAADLLAGPYRDRMNAATMLSQSKKCFSGRN